MKTEDLVSDITAHAVAVRRILVSRFFHERFAGVIQRGILEGYKLEEDSSWAPGDLAGQLFGLYEQEVLSIIEDVRTRRHTLVNLGAADGYYGVGLVATGSFGQSVCYELSEAGREHLKRVAERNKVTELVQILGGAGPDFPRELHERNVPIEQCLILSDVEGAEFDIFTPECLNALKGAEIIIELHDFLVDDGETRRKTLLAAAEANFEATVVRMGARDLSVIPELAGLNDSDRWLICSEGRAQLMSWLHLRPR